MTYGAEVTVRLPMLQIRDYADRPEVLRAIVDERFRVARLHLQDMVLRNTGVDIGDGKAERALPERTRLRLADWRKMTTEEQAAVTKWLAAEARLPALRDEESETPGSERQ